MTHHLVSPAHSGHSLTVVSMASCHQLYLGFYSLSIFPINQHSLGHRGIKGVPENIYFCLIDCVKAFDCVDHNKLWNILKEIGIPDQLNCLLRNLYAGQEATVRTGRGTRDLLEIGEGVHQRCILSPCLFNLYTEYIMQMPGWMNHELKSRLPGEISTFSDVQMILL